MTRVLVTGAYGLFGSTLVPYLRACGHDVRAHGRVTGEVIGDLSDEGEAFAALDSTSAEVIVNLVALADVDACERAPHRAYIGNVRVVENIANWIARDGDMCHLVQVSTDQVYDGPGDHVETDVTISNYYGLSKYAGELAAARVPSTVLRTNFFGPSRHATRTSWSDWVIGSLTEGKAITVFEDVCFSPLSMQRVAQFVERVAVERKGGVFNVGSTHGMSKADFAFALASALKLPFGGMTRGRSADLERAARRPAGMCMDSSHFARTYAVQLPTLRDEIEAVSAEYAAKTQ